MLYIYNLKLLNLYYDPKRNKLPNYFLNFDPRTSIGSAFYSIRNPRLQPPKKLLEAPRYTTRYQL